MEDCHNPSQRIVVDGMYEVISRFGEWTGLEKIVFLVRNLLTGELEVLKLYTPAETFAFTHEVKRNSVLK